MPASRTSRFPSAIGLIGFGAFGALMARHLAPHFTLRAYDPRLVPGTSHGPVSAVTIEDAASCPIVVLAGPVCAFEAMTQAIRPHLRRGTLVLDVGSVKTGPAEVMARTLPAGVDILATHPLFGPQSARDGIAGLKIALCSVRGRRAPAVARFLQQVLGLDVILTTPEAHDRDAATVQALTHLIARALVRMEPLPDRMTTRSFDLLMTAVGMVRHDAPEVTRAIEAGNPYAPAVRQRFLSLVSDLAAQ